LFKVSTISALISLNTNEKLEEIEGDPQITNMKSLNGVKIEELGEFTKEGNLVFHMGVDVTQEQRPDKRR
jgi:hypothetical protein